MQWPLHLAVSCSADGSVFSSFVGNATCLVRRNSGADVGSSHPLHCHQCPQSGCHHVNGTNELHAHVSNGSEYFCSVGGDNPFTWLCLHRLPRHNRRWIHSGIASYRFVQWSTCIAPTWAIEYRC